MISQIKQIAKRSKTGIIAYRIYDNWRAGRRFDSGKIDSSFGSTLQRRTLPESLNYIKSVFGDYLKYSGISAEMLKGKRVLEVGHGDNFGVALMFLAQGVAQVVCLDKFYSELDARQQLEIYRAIRGELNEDSKKKFDEAIKLTDKIEINPERLKTIYGKGIEKDSALLDTGSFDFIISRAVLEYSADIDAAFATIDRLLVPRGYMMHKIDLRDDGMFSSNNMHPLTFLTISEGVYQLMVANSGRPNRKLIDYYRKKVFELGYESDIFVTAILGDRELTPHKKTIQLGIDYSESTVALIDEIRPRLFSAYRSLPDEDLLISGIFLVAKKSQ